MGGGPGRQDDRGALVGAVVAGGFGTGWALWGASGLPDPAASIVRVAGLATGLVVIGAALRAVRGTPGSAAPGSMFTDRRYLVVTAAEVVAIAAGGAALNATDRPQYVCPWVAFVVGAHFLLFGRFFWAGFAALGAVLVGAALLGVVVGLVTGGTAVVVATTALISAAALFVAGGLTLTRPRTSPARRPRRPPGAAGSRGGR